jgi:hypothetical protein
MYIQRQIGRVPVGTEQVGLSRSMRHSALGCLPGVGCIPPGTGLNDFSGDILNMIKGYAKKVDESLDAIQRVDDNIETIKPYVPWMTVGMFVLAWAIVYNAVRR